MMPDIGAGFSPEHPIRPARLDKCYLLYLRPIATDGKRCGSEIAKADGSRGSNNAVGTIALSNRLSLPILQDPRAVELRRGGQKRRTGASIRSNMRASGGPTLPGKETAMAGLLA
jgi:hypothetical protein